MLSNPATPGWPTNATNTTPEIEGFASATSTNVSGRIDLYVDVRNSDTNFTIEIYRLGWYGGLGGRKMTWNDNGPKSQVTLPSRKQPIPAMNPTNGLIDCTLPCLNPTNGLPDSNLVWQSSYSLTIPPDWVSGVYVAKLTTGTNVAPQTTGKQSYIIFVVREDGRSSELLFQASMTTYQAYNPWGGRSTYPGIPPGAAAASAVSFNRPYAGPPTVLLWHWRR